MGRHGDRLAESTSGRGDGTAGGVALPLLAAALVCLLATSGIWLFSGSGGPSKGNDTAIGLNVPTSGPDAPRGPTAETTGSPAAGAVSPSGGSPSPTKSKTASATPSKSASQPPTSAPASGSASAVPPPPAQQPPPPPSPLPPPPSSQAPSSPPASPPPGTYTPSADAVKDWTSKLTLTIKLDYAGTPPTGTWNLSINPSQYRDVDCSGPRGNTCSGDDKSATGNGSAQVTFTIKYNWGHAPDDITYLFNGVAKTVSVRSA